DLDRGAAIIDQEVAARLKMGAEIRAWKYVRANNWRNQFRADLCSLFETYDLLALPTVPTTAPKFIRRSCRLMLRELPSPFGKLEKAASGDAATLNLTR